MKTLLAVGAFLVASSSIPWAAPDRPIPNSQMQAVLDELTSLNPKPLTELSPETTREQPTPADAVASLMKNEPLRSEGEALAKALQDAGVKTNLKSFDGVTHEFFGMGAVVDKAKEAMIVATSDLKAAFASSGFGAN